MTTGHQAELAVAEYLRQNGYKILELNWRTKIAEIDIIAVKNNVAYFIEVKYRSNDTFGEGMDYVQHKKLHKMRLGAELWVQQKNWQGDYELLVASVSGADFTAIEVLEALAY